MVDYITVINDCHELCWMAINGLNFSQKTWGSYGIRIRVGLSKQKVYSISICFVIIIVSIKTSWKPRQISATHIG